MSSETSTDNRVTLQGVLKFLAGAFVVGVVLCLMWYFSEVVVYILVSAVLAIMFRPMEKQFGRMRIRGEMLPDWVSATLTLFVIWALFGVFFSVVVPLVFAKLYQITNLDFVAVINTIEEPILNIQHYVQNRLSLPEQDFAIDKSLIKWVDDVTNFDMINSALTSFVSVVATSVIAFFSISFITFFFLKEDELFESMVASLFPSRYKNNVSRALNSISYLLSRYFVGLLCESAIIATSIGLVLICFGMPYRDALFMGVVMGLLNVVPYAGPFMGSCFCLCLGVITPIESMGIVYTIVTILGTIMVIKGVDDFVLQPLLYSQRVKAHPLEIFIVILMAGYVAGIVGMLLAIPSYTVLRVLAKEFFSRYALIRRMTNQL
ncbi:MAG: AI-2E family transporter [Rikenellaceae bacterium]